MINFCSYFDKNYIARFLVLRDSLINQKCKHNFYILALDNFTYKFLNEKKFNNVIVCHLKTIEKKFSNLKKVKSNRNLIEYYFTLSPYLPIFFQGEFNLKKLNYIDVDTFFFKNPEFFYSKLKNYSVILIKQNYKNKYGAYNVGWISYNFSNSDTNKILNDWKLKCTEWCYDRIEKNSYADQKYLDSWPLLSKDLVVVEPQLSMLSPWDNVKKFLISNNKNFYSYHFQGLKYSKKYFISGISLYQFNFFRKFIKEFYSKYIILLKNKQVKFNLEFTNTKSLRYNLAKEKKIIKKIINLIKTIKFYLFAMVRFDFYLTK
jgi:hypothetical protein